MKRILLLCIIGIGVAMQPVMAQFTEHVPSDRKLYVGPAVFWRGHTNFVSIFNQRDFTGWDISGDSRWDVVDGAMVAYPGNYEGTTRGMVTSQAEYANFIMKFQFSIEPEPNVDPKKVVNSGVFFRVPPDAKSKAMEGYEMEVSAHDDYEYPTGSIWRLCRSYPGLFHPNFWNDAEIYANGDHIRITVNGYVAIETWDRRSAKGQILFQHQRNGMVRYRDIELMELPNTVELPPTLEEQLTKAAGEFEPLFNGKDLSGWTTGGDYPDMQTNWGVEDGAITLLPGSQDGTLRHEKAWSDGILKLKFFMPDDGVSRDGNAGIFVRGSNDGPSNGVEAQIENVRDYHHWHPSGSIYNVAQGMFGWFKYNDWNEYVIYLKGNRMAVYLNGYKTADALLPKQLRFDRVLAPSGHVKIQSHEPYKKVQVKDIYLKVVD